MPDWWPLLIPPTLVVLVVVFFFFAQTATWCYWFHRGKWTDRYSCDKQPSLTCTDCGRIHHWGAWVS